MINTVENSVKMAVYGLEGISRDLCDILLNKEAFELRGAVDIDPDIIGEDVRTVIGRGSVRIEVIAPNCKNLMDLPLLGAVMGDIKSIMK